MKLINSKLALAVCIALSVTACSPDKTAEEYLSAAKADISASQNSGALIALKNAVRADLNNAEARVLLGSLYLTMGEAAAAEKELNRAITLSGDLESLLPKLLKALNLQNKSDETIALIEKYDLITPETLLYRALAYSRLGKKDKAKQSVIQANELSTDSIYSQLGDAYLNADSLDIDVTLEAVDKILAVEPELTEALMLKGQLHFAKKDFVSAIDAFNKYYNLLANNVQIRLYLANAYVKNEQFNEANDHLDFLLKLVPEHPFTNQLKGLIDYQQSDYKQALAHTEKAIQNGLDTHANRVVAGLSAFKLEQYELAHQYLVTLSEVLSPTHPVRRVLALVQMQLGYSEDAGHTLEDLEELTPQDVNLFTTATFELLKAGKIDEAKKLLAKTKDIVSDNSQEMTKLGILKLSMNDLEGLADLEKAVEIDPELAMAKMALAAAYIKSEEFDKALSLAEQWKQSNPKKVEGYNLAAKIHLLKKEVELAEVEFNLALSVNETNPYSLVYYANKAFVNKTPKESVRLLEKLLASSPDHIAALRLNYRAHKTLGSSEIGLEKIANSFSKNQNSLSHRFLYARALFIEKQFDEVITILKEIKSDPSTPTIYWLLLGESYSKVSKNDNTLNVYNDWIKEQPQLRAAWLKKVSIQEKLADYSGALLTVEQALAQAPEDGQFNVLRANYLILTKKFSEAQVQINALTNEQKELSLVKGLQGKVWLTEGKFKQALSGLEALYSIQPNPYNTALLFATHRKLDQEKVAFDFIQQHVETYSEDIISRNLLAESAITSAPELAKKHYLVLLKSTPDSLSILNNLAWIEYQLKNYQSAYSFIEQALVLDSVHPQVLDTAGLIQLKLGDKEKAIEFLSQAKSLAPKDTEIAKHYNDAVAQ